MKNYTLQNSQKSIHIVIFTGGLSPEPKITENFWKTSIASKPDFVIAADSGLEECLKYKKYFFDQYDFNPSKILGDFDSLLKKDILKSFSNEIIQQFPCDKDFTDTELALHYAFYKAKTENLKPTITLVGGDGGRLDHLLNIINTFRTKFKPDFWLCAFQQVAFLQKGKKYLLKNLELSDNISFANVFGKGNKIKTSGLQWESKLFLKGNMPSISNRISYDFYKEGKPILIEPKTSGFLIIYPYSAYLHLKND